MVTLTQVVTSEFLDRATRSYRIGPYILHRCIAYGGHSVVYEVTHPDKQGPLALKLAGVGKSITSVKPEDPSKGSDKESTWIATVEKPKRTYTRDDIPTVTDKKEKARVEMMMNERRILGILGEHENIASLEGQGEYILNIKTRKGEEKAFLMYAVYPRVKAIQTERLESGALSIEEVLEIMLGVANAGAYCHEHEVIHCDIKPANILVDRRTYKPKLTDFGIALYVPDGKLQGMLGSPVYMSPEHVIGAVEYKSDVFSLGSTSFHLLTGIQPIDSDEADTNKATFDIALKIAHGEMDAYNIPIRSVRPEAPKRLVKLINGMMAKKIQDRPGMKEVASEVAATKG
ncbi:serine/threonine protein kinase [Candidatus Woesearchaeota archaeon]|nr:serine/threonine protein kinase [Candidatus Woesearchaeota archaeon]